jgi:hypothetical protein
MEGIKKNMRSLRLLGSTLALGAALASGSALAVNSNVTASLMPSVAIVKVNDLAFGRFVPGIVAGNITVSPAGVRAVNAGDATLVLGAAVTAASFTVSGGANTTYAITLPPFFNVTSGANFMQVNGFSSSPSVTGTLSAGGLQTLNLGASLNVASGQIIGDYTASFNVTVAYN